MNTKIAKKVIHTWIFLCSILTLGIGWAALAHSEKPALLPIFSSDNNITEASLGDVPQLESLIGDAAQPSALKLNVQLSSPRLRTMGS